MNSYGKLINRARASIGIIGFVVVFCFVSTLQVKVVNANSYESGVPEWQRISSKQSDNQNGTGACSLSEKLIRYQVFSDEGADPPLIPFNHFDIEWLATPLTYFYRFFEELVYVKTRLHLRLCCFLE